MKGDRRVIMRYVALLRVFRLEAEANTYHLSA